MPRCLVGRKLLEGRALQVGSERTAPRSRRSAPRTRARLRSAVSSASPLDVARVDREAPEFAECVEEAADAAEAWWIDIGRKGVMLGTDFIAQTFIYLTKNIFPARFRDRQDHQITGANDGPIVQELRAPDLANIADPREALRQFEQFRSSLALAAPAQTKH